MPRNAASVRLSRVLRAGGIEPTPERVQRLADIAQWSIDQIIQRGIPRRPRPPPRRGRRKGWRKDDPKKAPPLKQRGRPPNPNMPRLFANLAMFWLDAWDELPAWTYNPYTNEYSGRFVAFAQALGAELAVDARALARDVPFAADPLQDFAADLVVMVDDPARVHYWLEQANIRTLKPA